MESVERKLGLLASRDPATRAYTLGHSFPLVQSGSQCRSKWSTGGSHSGGAGGLASVPWWKVACFECP